MFNDNGETFIATLYNVLLTPDLCDGHHVTTKQKGSVRIQMFDCNRETFIDALYNVLLAPDLCDRLISIITLMNAGHTCIFHKGFCTLYFGTKEDNAVTSPHYAVKLLHYPLLRRSKVCKTPCGKYTYAQHSLT